MACVIIRQFVDGSPTLYWDTTLNGGAGGWTPTVGSAHAYTDLYAAASDAERQQAVLQQISYVKIRDQVAAVDHAVPALI